MGSTESEERTELHARVEIALGCGALAEEYDRTVLAAPRRVALQRVAHAGGMRNLRREWRGDRMVVELLRAEVLRTLRQRRGN